MWENKRRDNNCAEAYDHAYEDDLTDRKVCIEHQGVEGLLLTVLAEPTVPLPAVITACTASSKMRVGGLGAFPQRSIKFQLMYIQVLVASVVKVFLGQFAFIKLVI